MLIKIFSNNVIISKCFNFRLFRTNISKIVHYFRYIIWRKKRSLKDRIVIYLVLVLLCLGEGKPPMY